MKYAIIIPDGAADEPLKELGGKTPLEAAETPNMDRIARETGLPLTLGYVDRTTMTVGLGPTIQLTGDVSADMDRIRAFYADKSGAVPENRVEPRMREELAAE